MSTTIQPNQIKRQSICNTIGSRSIMRQLTKLLALVYVIRDNSSTALGHSVLDQLNTSNQLTTNDNRHSHYENHHTRNLLQINQQPTLSGGSEEWDTNMGRYLKLKESNQLTIPFDLQTITSNQFTVKVVHRSDNPKPLMISFDEKESTPLPISAKTEWIVTSFLITKPNNSKLMKITLSGAIDIDDVSIIDNDKSIYGKNIMESIFTLIKSKTQSISTIPQPPATKPNTPQAPSPVPSQLSLQQPSLNTLSQANKQPAIQQTADIVPLDSNQICTTKTLNNKITNLIDSTNCIQTSTKGRTSTSTITLQLTNPEIPYVLQFTSNSRFFKSYTLSITNQDKRNDELTYSGLATTITIQPNASIAQIKVTHPKSVTIDQALQLFPIQLTAELRPNQPFYMPIHNLKRFVSAFHINSFLDSLPEWLSYDSNQDAIYGTTPANFEPVTLTALVANYEGYFTLALKHYQPQVTTIGSTVTPNGMLPSSILGTTPIQSLTNQSLSQAMVIQPVSNTQRHMPQPQAPIPASVSNHPFQSSYDDSSLFTSQNNGQFTQPFTTNSQGISSNSQSYWDNRQFPNAIGASITNINPTPQTTSTLDNSIFGSQRPLSSPSSFSSGFNSSSSFGQFGSPSSLANFGASINPSAPFGQFGAPSSSAPNFVENMNPSLSFGQFGSPSSSTANFGASMNPSAPFGQFGSPSSSTANFGARMNPSTPFGQFGSPSSSTANFGASMNPSPSFGQFGSPSSSAANFGANMNPFPSFGQFGSPSLSTTEFNRG